MRRRRPTQHLSHADCLIKPRDARHASWLRIGVVAVVTLGAAAAFAVMRAPQVDHLQEMTRLRSDTRQLRDQLERVHLDVQHEQATNTALREQIGQLTEQVGTLQSELAFMRSRKSTQ
ncbi:MAG: hypothetical protein QM639_14415 [Rhodocyclaceae bacterium]